MVHVVGQKLKNQLNYFETNFDYEKKGIKSHIYTIPNSYLMALSCALSSNPPI